MNVISKEELTIARESCELTMKQLIRKNAHIDVLKKQMADLLAAIENNPHPCNHTLIQQCNSAQKVIEITI